METSKLESTASIGKSAALRSIRTTVAHTPLPVPHAAKNVPIQKVVTILAAHIHRTPLVWPSLRFKCHLDPGAARGPHDHLAGPVSRVGGSDDFIPNHNPS